MKDTQTIQRPTFRADYKTSDKFDGGPRLVLGTSGLGGVWGGVTLDESKDAILYALERGARAFDTAPSYASAQEVLGAALKEWTGEKPFISTKVGRLKAESAHDMKLDYSSEGIRRTLESNLEILGVDRIDLLFLHEPQCVEKSDIPRLLEQMQGFVSEGLVSRLGIGGNLTEDFKPFMGKGKFEVISGFLKMNACNLDAFISDVSFIKEKGLAYYNASILHFGLLANRLAAYKENFENEPWLTKRDIAITEDLQPLAEQYRMSLPILAQRYAFGIQEADRIVGGAKNQSQIERTLDAWEQGPLSSSLFDTVTDVILNHY
ncbi:aldo/keto reductase [Marinoscillum furvescens]|uniref:Aryl-alcohol dehydrogenase-like predicted oxidoreductase n=1 Tax=Marinoscillum furvescens DSM 4134 TaxID=1122208 RepID=A0A3D9KZZ0_MARFU|nr:aldo/keto reductase [Marinoscillum furvescens]RED94982.1 aryl-alcohol dehydrogenase-like predicted oxidoreductase [Marinoscillum furvescens DSM 4134]